MKIGVVSDTHSQPIPNQLLEDFKKVDLIIHAGDFCTVDDLHVFSAIGDVKGVYGNMDEPSLRKMLPEKLIFDLEGSLLGVWHGVGSAKTLLERVKDEFKHSHVRLVVFGHSHQPLNRKIDDILYFNPGSPNDVILAPYCSYGIIEARGKSIEGKIIKIKKIL